jgi:gamma-glutamyltranspeptidase/glutathione hydrolase
LPDSVYFEKGTLTKDDSIAITKLGHIIRPIEDFHTVSVGRVDAVLVLPNGKLEGGADRNRGDDTASGY